MSEKSLVDVAPRRNSAKTPPMAHGSRDGDRRDEGPARDLQQSAARHRDREVGPEPVALRPPERRKGIDESRERADRVDEEGGVEVHGRREPLGEGAGRDTARRATSEGSRGRRGPPRRSTRSPIATSPVTSGRSGLFRRSISRSAIWFTMFDAAFIAEAHSEPMATVSTIGHVIRRAGSGLCADPKAQTAPERIPRSGGKSVKGRASRSQCFIRPHRPVDGALFERERDLEREQPAGERVERVGELVVGPESETASEIREDALRHRAQEAARRRPRARLRGGAQPRSQAASAIAARARERGRGSGRGNRAGRSGSEPRRSVSGDRGFRPNSVPTSVPSVSASAAASAPAKAAAGAPEDEERDGHEAVRRDVRRAPAAAVRLGHAGVALGGVAPLRRGGGGAEEEPQQRVGGPAAVGEDQESRDRAGDRARSGRRRRRTRSREPRRRSPPAPPPGAPPEPAPKGASGASASGPAGS